MRGTIFALWRRFAIIPLILFGGGLVVLAASRREPPAKAPVEEEPLPVRVLTLERTTLVPRAVGYGTIEPRRTWESMAQVGGQIVRLPDSLRVGALVEEGELLALVDPADYDIALDQSEAQLHLLDEQLAVVEDELDSTGALLAIEGQVEELARRELERSRKLHGEGTVSRSDLEKAELALLQARRGVQALTNGLTTLHGQRRELIARRQLEKLRRDRARLDLERTEIRAPFTGIIARLHVEQGQYVSPGGPLLTLDEWEVMEVTAQFREADFARLLGTGSGSREGVPSLDRVLVHGSVNGEGAPWVGRFDRYGDTVDRRTGTLGVVVRIEREEEPGPVPPRKGIFSRVEIHGEPLEETLLVPRSAIREGRVLLAGEDGRLAGAEVEVLFTQGEIAAVSGDVAPGDRVVLSNVSPAIMGMRLSPLEDKAARELVAREASP